MTVGGLGNCVDRSMSWVVWVGYGGRDGDLG